LQRKREVFMIRWKYFISWLPGIVIAIANGTIRQYIYMRYLAELTAHQLSVISFIILFGIYVWFIIPLLRLNSLREAFAAGTYWFCFTVIFEFLFGHYVMGHPWSVLFHDYNIIAGRLWIVVLLWTIAAPPVMYHLRDIRIREKKDE
jgi:hypothetical protein